MGKTYRKKFSLFFVKKKRISLSPSFFSFGHHTRTGHLLMIVHHEKSRNRVELLLESQSLDCCTRRRISFLV